CETINSDNEDLLARIETLQSNAKLLEVQILEVQRAKAMVDKELEAEKTSERTEDKASLQSSVQQYEEKNTKIKQLLVKTKKELADSKQAIQLAEITSERHKIHEHLKTSAEQHQRTLSAYQQRVTALQEESRAAKAEQATITSEFESYKVRVHNVLKQKNKSMSQTETEGAKQEREHLEMLIDQLKIKLQDSQNNLQINVSELQTLQSEHDTLLERHNKMLQETVSKEAELREKLCSIQSENMMMKSEHTQTVSQLTSQNEVLRNSFRDQVRHLQEEHRKTVETLQQQLSKMEAQLFQLKNEPTTRKPPLWHAEFTKEELVQKLSSITKSADHLNGLLRETEATNAVLMEQIKLLKSEIRRLERNQEQDESAANVEHLKNVLLQFIFLKPGSERERLLPVINTMLQLSPEEKGKLAAVAQDEEENASRYSG
ncbi:hypothetical protein CK820_G0053076, partial [Pan troglodytes]